ncbi:MAG: hypothetical protein M3143_07875 [Actinomycetota bacterium]|nr:hypothetical protein [Actinomycetota bacterium]
MKFLLSWLAGINERVKLLALGADLRRFVCFEACPAGKLQVTTGECVDRSDGAPPINEEIYQPCYRFVSCCVVSRAGIHAVRGHWPGSDDGFTALCRITGQASSPG